MITKLRKRLWYVEGLNILRHLTGDYFWASTSSEARNAWGEKYGAVPSRWELVR